MRYVTSSLIVAAVLTGGIAVSPLAAVPAVVDADSSVATMADSSADAKTVRTVTAPAAASADFGSERDSSPPDSAIVGTSADAAVFDELAATAQERGSVRVIVQLTTDVPFEGALAEWNDIVDRRASILNDQSTLASALSTTGSVIDDRYTIVPALSADVTPAGLAALRTHPLVAAIEPDVAVPPVLDGTVGIVEADLMWADGYIGTGYSVAVLDTGVQTSHPMFSDGASGTRVVAEACYSTTSGSTSDSVCPGGVQSSTASGSGVNCDASISGCDHGTHVAGIAVGREWNTGSSTISGVAPDAGLIAMQVFSKFTSSVYCSQTSPCVLSYTSDQLSALQRVQALSSSIDIAAVNMSLGGGQYYSACDNATIASTVEALAASGIATVIAAGNSGYSDSVGSPGCISAAVTVGSTTNGDQVSSFSNTDDQLIDLYAPGSYINSAIPTDSSASYSGTSMAAPHVAGAFALIRNAMPTATVEEIVTALQITGTPVSVRQGGSSLGFSHPRINIHQAVTAGASTLLNVVRSGTGNGSVTSSPAGIDCGATCSTVVDTPTTYTLTATADSGSSFSSWSGCDAVDGTTCTVSVNTTSVSVNASFTQVAPANDAFANATSVTSGSSITQSTVGATNEVGEPQPACDVSTPNSVWFTWSATANGDVTIDTKGSDFDTTLAVYTDTDATLAGLNEEDCDFGTPAEGWTDSTVTLTVTAGTNYAIQVFGFNSAAGSLTLNLAATASQQTLDASVSGNGTITSSPSGINCGSECTAVFANGTAVTLTAAPAPGSQLVAWAGDCAAMTVTDTCVQVMTDDKSVTAIFESIVTNDDFENAEALADLPFGTVVSTVGASRQTGEPVSTCGTIGQSIWYSYTPTVTAAIEIDLADSTFDTMVAVWSGGSLATLTEEGCNDDAPAALQSYLLTDTLAAGTTYYIQVGGYGGKSGQVDIDVSIANAYLNVGVAGDGSGSVSASAGGGPCTVDCTLVVDSGTVVSLTAAAATGSAFDGWSGACSGTATTCSVTVVGTVAVGASFASTSRSVDIDITGTGTVTPSTGDACDSDCTLTSDIGSEITFAAAAPDGTVFMGWTGDCAGRDSCTITVDNALTVGAEFVDVPAAGENLRATVDAPTISVVPVAVGSCVEILTPLPAGLGIDDQGSVSGTPTTASPFAQFVIASWNGDCDAFPVDATLRSLNIVVNSAVAPVVTPLETSAIAALDVVESVQNSTDLTAGENVQVAYPAGTFDPFEWVVLIAHSEPVTLGSGVSGADGGLSITVEMSEQLDPGAHNLVAMGTESGTSVRTPFTVSAADVGGFTPIDGERVLNTRDDAGVPKQGATEGYGVPLRVNVGVLDAVPADAAAVAVNITATGTEEWGFVAAYPCTSDRFTEWPGNSNVNFDAGATVANSAIVPLDDGHMCLLTYGKSDVIVDVSGYFAGGFTPIEGERPVNSRDDANTPKQGATEGYGDPLRVNVGALDAIPADAAAVAVNITATGAEEWGFVAAYPCASDDPTEWPGNSNVNFDAGATVANSAIVPLDDGHMCLLTYGKSDVIVDVSGYFAGGFTPIDGERPVNSRDDANTPKQGATEGYGDPLRVNVGALDAIPADAAAVAVNITATGAEEWGFVAAYPCGSDDPAEWPGNSNVNFDAGATVANSAIVPLDDGYMCLLTYGKSDVIVDVVGYMS